MINISLVNSKNTFKELGVQWIGLGLNNTCNIQCSYCPHSKPHLQQNLKNSVMDKEMALKILKEIKDDSTIEFVVLNDYGEPFLYPHFESVLSYCKTNNIKIRFATNGTLFTEQNIELVKKYQPEEMVISIQYFLKDGYQKVKGTKIDRDLWLNQIANFLKIHMQNNLETNIQLAVADNRANRLLYKICGLRLGDTNIPYPNKKYYSQLDEFIKEFCQKRLGIAFESKNTKIVQNKVYTAYYKINPKITFEIKHFFDSTNIYSFKQTHKVDCKLDYLMINPQGDILMCCEDFTSETRLGSIQDKTIKEILVDNYHVFTNNHSEKASISLCRRCYGERTYRGLFLKNLYSYFRRLVKVKDNN